MAQMLVDDQWVLGGGGEQGGIDQELLKLGPELLDRYGKDFAAAWNDILDQTEIQGDADGQAALSRAVRCLRRPSSPIDRLFTAIADETALTRDLGSGSEADTGTARNQPQDTADFAKGLARIGMQIAQRQIAKPGRHGGRAARRASIPAPTSRRSSGRSRLW